MRYARSTESDTTICQIYMDALLPTRSELVVHPIMPPLSVLQAAQNCSDAWKLVKPERGCMQKLSDVIQSAFDQAEDAALRPKGA